MRFFPVFAAATFMFASATAHAAGVTSFVPNTVVSALQDAGYKAKLVIKTGEDPEVDTAANGFDIALVFTGCEDHASCQQIEFITYWDCSKDLKKCQEQSTKWNSDEHFAHTLITEDKSVVIYRHTLFDKEGMSPGLFVENLEYFSTDVGNFSNQL